MSTSSQQKCRLCASIGNLKLMRNSNIKSILGNRDTRTCSSARQAKTQAYHDNLTREDSKKFTEADILQNITQTYCNSTQINEKSQKKSVVDDVLAKGDFTVYQEADLYDFFTRDTVPKRVSQVCLMNDHFILVKMPESCWRRSSNIESIMEENETEDVLENQGESKCATSRNKAAKYFRCNRSRKISPMHDVWDTEYDGKHNANKLPCKVGKTVVRRLSMEVYDTVTKISGRPMEAAAETTKLNQEKEHVMPTCEKHETHEKHVRIIEPTTSNSSSQASEHARVSHIPSRENYYNSSISESISLDNRGALVTPDINIINGNIASVYHPDAISLEKKRKKLKSQRRFDAIRWLVKAFSARAPKKPKSKIHAVIYKTYFVRWKKASSSTTPSDNYLNGFGVKPNMEEELPKLKRCRSANF